MPLWRALRVVSGARGVAQVGRARGAVRRPRPRAARRSRTSSTPAPTRARRIWSRSRASPGSASRGWRWEFYKYFDGIAQITYWHRGRCLSYGEGVTYWALADMVRMRARIAEDEEPGVGARQARGRRRGARARRRRSAASSSRGSRTCSGSRTSGRYEREDLFAAWRLFFERLADVVPGGDGLRGHAVGGRVAARLHRVPARVVAELADLRRHAGPARAARAPPDLGRRPAATSRRSTSSRSPETAMEELLDGLVPGLPVELRAQILDARGRRSRCTRSRRCGCCSTVARSSRKGRSTGRPARSSRSRSPRRCTR